jgi:predicted CoA-substrate-specific enzyme activase
MGNLSSRVIHLGLDIGSVSTKLAALTPRDIIFDNLSVFQTLKAFRTYEVFIAALPPQKVQGQPLRAAKSLLQQFIKHCPTDVTFSLSLTGSQSKLIASALGAPLVNDFKAIARGVVELVPEARTILEIGGDGSRYIKVNYNPDSGDLGILDYGRNGECAAGTGSFIDQQAVRLNYEVEEIGDVVAGADGCANIAGRCSVFAKSDMIHAQQRGYSPGAIFKGLCEAVVRNYKGTVLRGKQLEPKIVFVGGVAANSGVVEAMRSVFNLSEEEFIVPTLHQYVGAIGCAMQKNGAVIPPEKFATLADGFQIEKKHGAAPRLETERVSFENLNVMPYQASQFPIPAYLGFDIGSVSTNLVLVDEQGVVIDEIYTRTEGRPIQVVQRELDGWRKKWAQKVDVLGVGSTGSGRELIGELVGADAVHDEITAHKTGADAVAKRLFNDSVDTIFEIGGQDSKFISIDDGVVVDFAMNEACAAGTGSFLEEQAGKLGISIKEDFAELALSSEAPIRLGERCTVFMEKDVTAFMQQGHDVKDITAGLAYAVVQNYLNRVVRGRKIGERIYFQGGTAYNKAVAAAFSTVLEKKIIVPPHNGVIGAIGAALLARDKMSRGKSASRFRGFDLSLVDFKIRQFICKGCSNNCDIQECTINGERTYWGDKCSDRFHKKAKTEQKPLLDDLFSSYNTLLMQDFPGPDGRDVKIGIPRTMYFYDRFPFWQAYFSNIGAEVVLSDVTNKSIAAQGREFCIAEPCFPIVAGHGHYLDLQQKNADFIFLPQIINSETEKPETESWVCPWGQTLTLMIRNGLQDETQVDKLLMPIVHFRDGIDFVKKEMHSVAKTLGVSKKISDNAVDLAFKVQARFQRRLQEAGQKTLHDLESSGRQAVVIVGRPYNVFDPGINLSVPEKLRTNYGVDVIPMDFLPLNGIEVGEYHENMFWSYGRKIMQAAIFAGQSKNLHLVYFTNFKCGPDSYIKHFIRDAVGSPYLTLQFDDHGNDAGIMTRCEAYLESKRLLHGFSERRSAVEFASNQGA